MKTPKNIQSQGANLTINEIEELAEEIREKLIGNKGVDLNEYVERALNITPWKLGHRLTKALKYETKLEVFFPDRVFSALQKKTFVFLRFNKNDDEFLTKNGGKGAGWLASRFYTTKNSIWSRAKVANIKLEREQCVYPESFENFIRKHKDKGCPWIADKLNLGYDAIHQKAKRMGVKLKRVDTSHQFIKEEDEFIRKNKRKGTMWIAEKLGLSYSSIRHRAYLLDIKISYIKDGKVVKKYRKGEDKFIRNNAEKGSSWIATKIKRSSASIRNRAVILRVKLSYNKLRYSKEEDEFIRNNAEKGSLWIAKRIGRIGRMRRTTKAIRNRAKRINVKLTVNNTLYSKEENEFIRNNAEKGVSWIAKRMRRTTKAIRNRAKRINVKITYNKDVDKKYKIK